MSWKKSFYIIKSFKNQRLPSKKLKKLQFKKLKSIIKYAYKNSKFYKEKFDKAIFNPDDFKTLKDIQKIPMTTKEEVRDNINKILIGKYNPKKYHILTTSGSTGEPLCIIHDERSLDYTTATYARFLFSIGYKPWQKIAFFRSKDSDFRKVTTFLYHKLGLLKKIWVDPASTPNKQIQILKNIKPDIIVGFPFALKLIAELLEKNDWKFKIKVNFIVCHAEILLEKTRDFLQSVFNCPVYNWYSSTEFMGMASECPLEKNLHIEGETVYIESINNTLICTGLENYTMPLIRYNIGDKAILSNEPCSCNRTSPFIKSFEGRLEDFLVTSSKKRLSPGMLTVRIRYLISNDEIKTFKIIQKSPDLILMKIVKGGKYNIKVKEKIKRELCSLFGNIKIVFQEVKNIEKEKSGKFRYVITDM